MASVTASLVLPAPPAEVWAVVSDVESARRWNQAWKRVEVTSDAKQGKGVRFRTHGEDNGEAFEFEVADWLPEEYISFAPIRSPDEERYEITLDYHAFRLEEVEGGHTRVDLTAHATTRGIRGKLVGLFLWPGHQKAGLERALRNLGAVFGLEAEEEE
ncbi:MAG TPA: SRPBCC family protein [Dehalococcoidia bacterium]|nr:SRPBCC family protein [Dehalococcoidia bacterium]